MDGVAGLPKHIREAIERLLPPAPNVVTLEARAEVARLLTEQTHARIEAEASALEAVQAYAKAKATLDAVKSHMHERMLSAETISAQELNQVLTLIRHHE